MAHDRPPFELVRFPMKVRKLEVLRAEALTPQMRRITFGGPELAGFTSRSPEDHVKLFFPRPEQSEPVLPTLGPLGVMLPTLGPKPIGRDYTPRRHDEGELDIDFFLHGGGVAARWAAGAKPGDVIGVAGPRGSFVFKGAFSSHLFVGDESALPEFAGRIATLGPSVSVTALVVSNGELEHCLLLPSERLHVHWVVRPTPDADSSELLLTRLRKVALEAATSFAWLAGEASEIRHVYRYLVRERAWPKNQLRASGHWKRGVADHDHHQPIE